MTQPNFLKIQYAKVNSWSECTLSRISTRFFVSVRLSGGKPLDDCSARNVVDTMKAINCDSSLSLVRSSRAIGGKSDEDPSSSVGYAQGARIGAHSGGLEFR